MLICLLHTVMLDSMCGIQFTACCSIISEINFFHERKLYFNEIVFDISTCVLVVTMKYLVFHATDTR